MIKSLLLVSALLFVSKSFSQNYNAEVTNSEDSYTVKHGVLYESHSVSIQINNAKGDEYASAEIYYSEDSPIYDLKAWIEDANGKKVRKLKKAKIVDLNNLISNNLYDDTHIKTFELKHNTYPYTIKYCYCCKKKEFLSICHWSPIYNSKIPTLNAKLTLDVPSYYKVALYENKANPPIKDSLRGVFYFKWQESYLHPLTPEALAPPTTESVPSVFIVPLEFNYGISGSQQDWVSFGNWIYNLNKGLDELPESEIQKVHELINGISDKKLIVKRLYQYVQDNTRYISVQIGIGAFKAFSADFTSKKKYGDCKALANYMKALLKAAGISSNWVLISAGSGEGNYEVINKFPSIQFNHVILVVPLENDSIWLDCTSKTNPTGYLGTFTQNRYALIVEENKSRLIKTPALTPSNCYTLCRNNMRIDTSGNIILSSHTICKGYSFDICSSYSEWLNNDKQKEYLNNILPYKDFEVKQLNIKNPNRDSASINLEYKVLLKNNITQSGHYMFLQLCSPPLPEFENPTKRLYPLLLKYPINYIDTTIVYIPDKYKAEKPLNENIQNEYGYVTIKYVLVDNKVNVYRSILIKSGQYPLEDYQRFYQFIANVRKAIDKPIGFTKYE